MITLIEDYLAKLVCSIFPRKLNADDIPYEDRFKECYENKFYKTILEAEIQDIIPVNHRPKYGPPAHMYSETFNIYFKKAPELAVTVSFIIDEVKRRRIDDYSVYTGLEEDVYISIRNTRTPILGDTPETIQVLDITSLVKETDEYRSDSPLYKRIKDIYRDMANERRYSKYQQEQKALEAIIKQMSDSLEKL